MARTAARLMAEMLDGYGVTHVFFVPTIVSHTLREIEERTPIHRILTHGEKSAAYMADGYARAGGRPGVCFAQTVGAANLAAGLRDAALAGSPVLAITGGPYPGERHRHRYQESVDLPHFAPVTKASWRVDTAGDLARSLRQALRTTTADRPGPVHLELPGHLGEVLEMEEVDTEPFVEPRFAVQPPLRPEPPAEDVAAVARHLHAAQRPVIVVGGGARTSQAGSALVALAERCGIPIVTSLNAKAQVPADHPLNVGVVGLYSRSAANRLVAETDLAFFVGSRTGSQVTHKWRLPPEGTAVIQCDIVGTDLGINYPNIASLVGDARRSIELLLAEMAQTEGPDRSEWLARSAELRSEWYEEWTPRMDSDAVPILPERLCRDLGVHLPADAIVVADTGHAGMWTAGFVDLASPDQDFIRAAGHLGWAFPAALGAKCAAPDRPVVAFTGDGGFYYHLAEVETAVRCGINAVIVVNNNNSLNQEIGIYTNVYGGELHGRHHELWKFNDVDVSAVAKSLGAASFRVERPEGIGPALDAAFDAGTTAVVEVITDETVRAPVAWTPA